MRNAVLSQVSTKTTVVNFSVKQLGLEAQLLGIVVQREQPSLEEQSSELTLKARCVYRNYKMICKSDDLCAHQSAMSTT